MVAVDDLRNARTALTRALFRTALGSRLPITSGALQLDGPEGQVTIRRDKYGIPMIEAGEELDVFFGFGFCQGQDRAVQIELSKRAASGTLSELFGSGTLRLDRLFRRASLRHAAEAQFDVLSPRVASILSAFAAGVNAGWEHGLPARPHEMSLLRSDLTEFTAIDVVAILKLQSFTMPSNWDSELARMMVLDLDGPDALRDLDPAYPEWHRVAVPPTAVAGKAAERLAEDLALAQEAIGAGGGSNAWAVSGDKTRTGRPILANDPHLAPSLPPHWYLARMQSPKWVLAGAALAGTPAIAVGHNGHCAWGVTAGLTDNTDLYLERIGPDGRSVLQDGEYVPCESRTETIQIKGAEPVDEEVLVTPRGPLISPALDGELGAVSMCAVWLDALPIGGFLGTLRARTIEEFRAPFAEWPILPLDIVCADTHGNIGFQLVGQAPRRRTGNGTLPAAGWDSRTGWEEQGVPFEDMPHTVNPECGYVAAANTQPQPGGEGPFLGADWIDGYRLGRITEALEERSDWDIPASASLQMDVKSMPWTELREAVLAGEPGSPESRAARALLETWDGRMSAGSLPATLFHIFLAELSGRITRARAPRSAAWLLGRSLHPVSGSSFFAARQVGRVSRLLRGRREGWFPNGWQAEIDDALRESYATAVRCLGEPSDRWQWGRARKVTLSHPLGRPPLLSSIFNIGPFECPGDVNTVAQAGTVGEDPLAGPGAVPSLRMVLDVGDWDASLFSLPGGQSGNPLSPHYSDLLPFWLEGRGVPIPWSDEAVKSATEETLLLSPAS